MNRKLKKVLTLSSRDSGGLFSTEQFLKRKWEMGGKKKEFLDVLEGEGGLGLSQWSVTSQGPRRMLPHGL